MSIVGTVAETMNTSELEEKLQHYERWFKVMDTQMRLLEVERQKLSAVVNHTDAGFFNVDSALKVVWANEEFSRHFHPDDNAGNMVGRSCNQVLCKKDVPCQSCPVVEAYTSGTVAHHEFTHEIRGTVRDIYATALPIKTPEGAVRESMVMVQDVTDLDVLKRSQRALEASESKFRSMFRSAAAGMALISPEGKFLEVNPAFCELLGYSNEELLQMDVEVLSHPDDLEKTREAFGGNKDEPWPRVARMQKRCIKKDGNTVWSQVSLAWIFDDADNPVYSIALVEDVTERKLALDELRRSEARKGAILETALDCVITIDHEGRILEFNPAAERTFGYTRREALGQVMAKLIIPPKMRGQHTEGLRKHLASGERSILGKRIELQAMRADGSIFPAEAAITRIPHDGPPIFTGYIRDLTEQKKAEAVLQEREEQLRQAQKMEAIGTLAGGLAHDFNNILAGIMGHAEMLKVDAHADERILKTSDVIKRASQRGAELTKALLGFARGGKQQDLAVNIHQTIEEIISLLERTIDKNVRIRRDFRLKDAFTMGDPGQIEQVIMNLAINARDAMPEGGELTFTTDLVEFDEAYCVKNAGARPGQWVQISVSDTGTGIPDEIMDRLFEPFFTTKEQGKGTGMGLAMVYGIINNHGGSIQVKSRVSVGTSFAMNLIPADPPEQSEPAPEPRAAVTGTGLILVVDDEEVVREVTCGFLDYAGYKVLTAPDGEAALDIYRERGSEIDLVIMDMVMPRMGGRDCFHRLKEMNSSIRVILSTGHGFNVVAQEMLEEGMIGFIPKPYEMSELTEAVSKALAR